MNTMLRLMGKRFLLIMLLVFLLGPIGRISVAGAARAVTDFEMAFHWAPVLLHRVDTSAMGGAVDFITRFDYDGNFAGRDNWDNLSYWFTHRSLQAAGYYYVTEAGSHFYIYYAFYHPRDWLDGSFESEHENDFEGLLVFVRKDGSRFGRLEGFVTKAHKELFYYRAIPQLGPRSPDRDRITSAVLAIGQLPGETHARPQVYQQSQGHAVYGCGETRGVVIDGGVDLRDCSKLTNIIKYLPSRGLGQTSVAPPPGGTSQVSYQLIDMMAPGELFEKRFLRETFADFNKPLVDHRRLEAIGQKNLNGDCSGTSNWKFCNPNAAQPPWGWRDGNFGSLPFGMQPSRFIAEHFDFGGLPQPTGQYIRNDVAAEGNACDVSLRPLSIALPEAPTCVKQICAVDGFCCNNSGSWDAICVSEVATVCGQQCDQCPHLVTEQGAAMPRGCNRTVDEICNRDPFCCETSWDGFCVSAAKDTRNHLRVRYDVHVEDLGWMEKCRDGDVCGTTHEGKRLEAVKVFAPITGGRLCYQVYLAEKGWQQKDWTVCDGRLAGTIGESRRMEAIKIRLLNAPAGHHVKYRAYIQDHGWQSWVIDGAQAGTTGQSKRLEALQVKIVIP